MIELTVNVKIRGLVEPWLGVALYCQNSSLDNTLHV